MTETSSDDFSDTDYAQNKAVAKDHKSDVDSFEEFRSAGKLQSSTLLNQQQSMRPNSADIERNENESFGSDEFEADSPPDDDDEDNDDNNAVKRGNPHTGSTPITDIAQNATKSDAYYNPRDYDTLQVSSEIRRLFEYIERFKYNEIELETQLKPFIPEYIPSIGNVDCFIKPTRTTTNYEKQESEEKIGICYLDEPILHQSDPSTFYLKLTNESKQVSMNKHAKIGYIADAERNTNKLRKWIDNFKKIKSKTMSHDVNTEKLSNFPKVEEVMQPFMDDKLIEFINHNQSQGRSVVPPYKIDLTLLEYSKIICNLLDIPVDSDDDIHTSLHVLFSTYAALQSTHNTT
eukprot:CAMPEP_0202695212 /NCGR_PEP_ID=MMETSP1385-20130828/8859_1 /ASSEMBLY_ACC=CAM_ASM_000861 /TAXON_ID=933848 /ORGANISM="Elphidium margaritaceum" /LENGTH=346 /DNA_ID=CAMNT_0049351193 /DNA_START=24 /DNA_END=1064 /DNA_ORIENTATION=-